MNKAPFIQAKGEGNIQIQIDDEIGFWGVTASEVISQIKESGAKNIELRINSIGGSVTDALSIYNYLKDFKGIVTTKVDGLAASAATVIAQAANKGRRYTAESAMWMVHEASIGIQGNKSEIEQAVKILEAANESIKSIYRANGVSDEMIDSMFDGQDHWFVGGEAISNGFADKTYNAGAKAASKAYKLAATATDIPEDIKEILKNNNNDMKRDWLKNLSTLFDRASKEEVSLEDSMKEFEKLKNEFEQDVKENEENVNALQAKVDGFEAEKETAIQDAVKPLEAEKVELANKVTQLEKDLADAKSKIADNKGPEDKGPEGDPKQKTAREIALEQNANAIKEAIAKRTL